MKTRGRPGRHGDALRRALASLGAVGAFGSLALAACAEGDVPASADAEAPLLSARAMGDPREAEADQWLPAPESLFDGGVGSRDASPPGAESPPDAATPGSAPDADGFGGASGAPMSAPATEPAPMSAPPTAPPSAAPTAPACPAEICNGLDDDCDGTIDDGAARPCDVVARDGMPYLVCANAMGWFAARNICHSVGYDLAVVGDAAEDAFLFGEIARRGFGNTWLGLNDHAAEGHWVWLDGQPLAYSHWDSGEPNNGGRAGEDCGVLMTDDGRQTEWDDRDCDSARPFLCELDAAP